MSKTNLVPFVLEQYKNGQRYFEDLDIENESFEGQDLEGIIFERCLLYVSFRGANLKNAKFINGGIKTCDFQEADLTNARFENVSVESSEFARSKIENTYFNNNWAYGQPVVRADFEDWIKDYPENRYMDELNRIKTCLLQFEKHLEGSNYEPHFKFDQVCDSTHLEKVVPELNKIARKKRIDIANLKEISFNSFKAEVVEKIHYSGDPGPNNSPETQRTVSYIEEGFWQLVKQKFNPNEAKFYFCPHDDQWIFWSFSFLIVSKERNKSYLFEGGASD